MTPSGSVRQQPRGSGSPISAKAASTGDDAAADQPEPLAIMRHHAAIRSLVADRRSGVAVIGDDPDETAVRHDGDAVGTAQAVRRDRSKSGRRDAGSGGFADAPPGGRGVLHVQAIGRLVEDHDAWHRRKARAPAAPSGCCRRKAARPASPTGRADVVVAAIRSARMASDFRAVAQCRSARTAARRSA